VIVTTFMHIIVMLFDRGKEGKEEMKGIIDYSAFFILSKPQILSTSNGIISTATAASVVVIN